MSLDIDVKLVQANGACLRWQVGAARGITDSLPVDNPPDNSQ